MLGWGYVRAGEMLAGSECEREPKVDVDRRIIHEKLTELYLDLRSNANSNAMRAKSESA
jgi:hypothetical protein